MIYRCVNVVLVRNSLPTLSVVPRVLLVAHFNKTLRHATFRLLDVRRIGVDVDGGGRSADSKSTQRDRAAHYAIDAAVANLGFLDICSSHSMLPNKRTN
ncbi:hypothetical protein Y032_0108g20 [Ancylostoma ceylanicum]|uniref:Uncharacterized protein n=1 Tax=Ancylostoma ceylanicum TaxID=53326 RepID=A0A016TEZ5_9BILA|nr:hypothetical protein Y032_0108g20 [Ancylostoma ceylanicum]